MDTLAFPFECKSIDDAGLIEGTAAAFGNVDRGGDRIMPGAFAKSIAAIGKRPVPLLLYHDTRRPAGAWTELSEGPDGLTVKGRLSLGVRDGAEAHTLVRDGALTGLSIGYLPTVKSFVGEVRELRAVDLLEISLVPVPMNDRTGVTGIKSIAGVRDIEALLREGGLSGRQAKAAASAAWKSINTQSDEQAADEELAALFKQSAARVAAL